jgi:N-acylglucosamine 2-epimerase
LEVAVKFDKYICRYENELFESVIPFWEAHCVDNEFGGYFTCLDRDGAVYDHEKFMWMQWRIVYMFATLFMTEHRKEKWLDMAIKGYDFLVANGKDQDGFYYFALNRRGEPSMAPYSIFSDCFAAMGAAALHKATGEKKYREEADSAMRNYISRMDNPKGRWEKSLSGRAERLNLGHYMILANLGCVMKECLGTDEYNADTESAVQTVIDRFWNPDKRVVFENINSDGSFDFGSCDGRHVIPGHGLESMWFIMRYAERCGRSDLIEKACEYTRGLLDFGWDDVFGGIYYFMDALGKPHVELQADMKLWWVHNEALIATLYAYRLSGKKLFWDWFEKLDKWTWSHFPDPVFGEWFGYLDRAGEPSHSLKGGKWKTFFHLPRFLLVSIEEMRLIKEEKL